MNRLLIWMLVPAIALAAGVTAFLSGGLFRGDAGIPPIEYLTVERVILDKGGITAIVRAEGSEPVSLAQVQVDGAYWSFVQTPPGPIGRLSAARIMLPYPWIGGETHRLRFVSAAGATFDHTIEVAIATPKVAPQRIGEFVLLGLAVGLVPVVLGMLAFPALRQGGARVTAFALALTMGLLGFLFIETLDGALENAARAVPGLHVGGMVWLVMVATVAVLLAIGRRGGAAPSGIRLAFFIALGIGLHNFGEGLAIGAAYATGSMVLGSFLVLGFTLHNVTEGVGIVAPLLEDRPGLKTFAGLALLAGLPIVPGIALGASVVAAQWAALALAVGAGAILQVVVEIGALIVRRDREYPGAVVMSTTVSGFVIGIAVMYGTALLVEII
ncbi:MAG: metal transporter [Alphaproteobacteria bacterium]